VQLQWTCSCCGKAFDSLPFAYGWRAPDPWRDIPEETYSRENFLTSDACVIEGRDRFIRGCLDIPVGGAQTFEWGVWVSLSEESFARAHELWDGPVPADEKPRFGWLCTEIPVYPSTLHLKTHVHFRDGNRRPLIKLEPTDHPLAVEQRNGITMQRVQEIAAALLHQR
jgi:hypothetical protein